jgi:release factor glutamine methyltransferase
LTRKPVLIPRPETEQWSLNIANLLSPTVQHPITLLDLCTGSGCIPILLSHLWPPGSVRAYGIDISHQAIQLAQDNAKKCHIPPHVFIPIQADIRHTPFVLNSKGPFDLITSNPPYISNSEYHSLPPSVKDYEDPRALIGGDPDGLFFYHLIARLLSANGILSDHSLVVLEVGHQQAEIVQHILRTKAGLHHSTVWKDNWGKDRTVLASRRPYSLNLNYK